jgi:hypothetical protein
VPMRAPSGTIRFLESQPNREKKTIRSRLILVERNI